MVCKTYAFFTDCSYQELDVWFQKADNFIKQYILGTIWPQRPLKVTFLSIYYNVINYINKWFAYINEYTSGNFTINFASLITTAGATLRYGRHKPQLHSLPVRYSHKKQLTANITIWLPVCTIIRPSLCIGHSAPGIHKSVTIDVKFYYLWRSLNGTLELQTILRCAMMQRHNNTSTTDWHYWKST